jgi:hypothetical protein
MGLRRDGQFYFVKTNLTFLHSFTTPMSHSPPALRLIPMGLFHFLLVALCLPRAYAYTWTFKSPPQQCGNLTINISGGGVPPYRVLIIPFGPSPLSNVVEARTILDMPFEGNSTELTFQLKYPQNSQLVAVVSELSIPFIFSIFFFLFSTLCELGRCSSDFSILSQAFSALCCA